MKTCVHEFRIKSDAKENVQIIDEKYNPVANMVFYPDGLDKKTAHQIVNVLNCHKELVESLQKCVQFMVENVNYQEDKDFKLTVDSACKVIAKAEGK